MKIMQSFLMFFYILDQCYDHCYRNKDVEEDDLPWFLSAICPELWGNGKPMDMAIFYEWQSFIESQAVDVNNIMEKTYSFLEYYEKKWGFHYTIAKQWILATTDKTVVETAYDRTEYMYEKYKYDN
ncbi:MAG: hypothetical protein HDR05_13400 [Lachnospiraceae bacterium]|nr:hypothetical protein [Lachnospiraceae bacterium]